MELSQVLIAMKLRRAGFLKLIFRRLVVCISKHNDLVISEIFLLPCFEDRSTLNLIIHGMFWVGKFVLNVRHDGDNALIQKDLDLGT